MRRVMQLFGALTPFYPWASPSFSHLMIIDCDTRVDTLRVIVKLQAYMILVHKTFFRQQYEPNPIVHPCNKPYQSSSDVFRSINH